MKKKISSIIFDFGNVLLDLDLSRSVNEMEHMLGLSYDAYHQEMPAFFQDFERGSISEREFYNTLKEWSRRDFGIEEFRGAWNSMLGKVPEGKFELLRELRQKGYAIYLFSNTNETHLAGVKMSMGVETFQYFETLFDQCFYSCRIGHRKPDEEAFRYVLHQAGLEADKTLFVDDGNMHIEGARRVGLEAVLYIPGSDLSELFRGF